MGSKARICLALAPFNHADSHDASIDVLNFFVLLGPVHGLNVREPEPDQWFSSFVVQSKVHKTCWTEPKVQFWVQKISKKKTGPNRTTATLFVQQSLTCFGTYPLSFSIVFYICLLYLVLLYCYDLLAFLSCKYMSALYAVTFRFALSLY